MSEQLKAQFEQALQKYKEIESGEWFDAVQFVLSFFSKCLDREKYISDRQQLESQLTENTLVKSEFDYLDEDAKVYKLIGACLIRQDIAEARVNVEKRIEYITAEIISITDVKPKEIEL
uniref:Tetratricopeptide repeat protein n=1 Tax=Angiostrongylus cantonensis TaxID=6313 RepID=A0A0K0CT39_ANGCA